MGVNGTLVTLVPDQALAHAHSATPFYSPPSNNSSAGMSGGAVAGLVVGCVVGAALLGGGAVLLLRCEV